MRPLSHVVPSALMHLLQNAPLSAGKVAFAWRAAVGPALERVTSVSLDGTTLIVETASVQWAREIKRSNTIILSRLQSLLGAATVTRIEIRK